MIILKNVKIKEIRISDSSDHQEVRDITEAKTINGIVDFAKMLAEMADKAIWPKIPKEKEPDLVDKSKKEDPQVENETTTIKT